TSTCLTVCAAFIVTTSVTGFGYTVNVFLLNSSTPTVGTLIVISISSKIASSVTDAALTVTIPFATAVTSPFSSIVANSLPAVIVQTTLVLVASSGVITATS